MNGQRKLLLGGGISFIILAVVILVLSLWESFGGMAKQFKVVELPGFQELKLETPGLYAGLYQHSGSEPLPVAALSKMTIRLMSKATFEDVPLLLNSSGQLIERFGVQAMPLFNFVIENPGDFVLSGVYPAEVTGPTVPVLIFAQAAQNMKQTLIVGGGFFFLFLVIGIFMLLQLKKLTPPLVVVKESKTKKT